MRSNGLVRPCKPSMSGETMKIPFVKGCVAAACAISACVGISGAIASSHREAPMITQYPKVDNTDLYAFRSYEPGREGYVVILANFIPLQDAYAGPNFFTMDPDAVYEIHI